jgi:predicted lipoprotein with Yx(FWY)xxD motif
MITYSSPVTAPADNGQPRRMGRWSPLMVGALIGAAALIATACSSARAVPPHTTAPAAATTAAAAPPHRASAPAVLEPVRTRLGVVLADRRGRTVYVFTADRPGHSVCTAGCLQFWPFVAAPATIPSDAAGVTARLGILDRADGGRQLTVNGYPIYTFAGDTGPGSTAGQGQRLDAGVWWALTTAGARITTGGPVATPPPTPAQMPPVQAPPVQAPPAPPPTPAGIPQNDGGDHDGDNNGGPNDGDGNV